jgi:hypothetical protein
VPFWRWRQLLANSARQGRFVESQARKVRNDILERVGEDKISSDTVASFLRDWLKGKDNPGTADRYGYTVECLGRIWAGDSIP